MEYSIKLNGVRNSQRSVKSFATVTFGEVFKITNVAVVENRDGGVFVSMPSFRSKERNDKNEAVYKDVCHPITAEFRAELYSDILALYEEMEQAGKTEVTKEIMEPTEPEFHVAVTPYEREGSNILGLARIYFEDSFVVNNVSILKGKEKEFVAMPSYLAKQKGKEDKPQYQDVCFPVTKEFREKLCSAVIDCYEKQKEMRAEKASRSTQRGNGLEPASQNRETPFR